MRVPPRKPASAWIPATMIGLASVVALPVLAAAPRDPHRAAGVFPPWWSQAAVLDAAAQAGAVLSVGRAPFIVVVRAETGDAPERLRQAGAILALDPSQALACAD